MTDGGNWKDLVRAATQENGGNVALVMFHADHGVDINYQHPEYLTTAMHEAIRVGNIEVVKALLAKGADPTIEDNLTSSTPMQVAMECKQHAIVDILLEAVPKGYELDCKTILFTGYSYKDRELLAYFLNLGHRIVLGIKDRHEKYVKPNVEALKQETGNSKIRYEEETGLKSYFQKSKLNIDVWLHKSSDKEESLLTDVLKTCQSCSLGNDNSISIGKVLLLVESSKFDKRNMEQLSWLLSATRQNMSGVLEPTSVWSRMTHSAWHNVWCASLAQLLGLDGVEGETKSGKLYTYNMQPMNLPDPATGGAGTGSWEKQFHGILV